MKLFRLLIIVFAVFGMSSCDNNGDSAKDNILLVDEAPMTFTSNPIQNIGNSKGYVVSIEELKKLLGDPTDVIIINQETLYIYDYDTVLVILMDEDSQTILTYWNYTKKLTATDFLEINIESTSDDVLLIDSTTIVYNLENIYFSNHKLEDGTIMSLYYELKGEYYIVTEKLINDDKYKVLTEAYLIYSKEH